MVTIATVRGWRMLAVMGWVFHVLDAPHPPMVVYVEGNEPITGPVEYVHYVTKEVKSLPKTGWVPRSVRPKGSVLGQRLSGRPNGRTMN